MRNIIKQLPAFVANMAMVFWKSRNQYFAFLFFLALSFIFWLAASLSKDYHGSLKLPLSYTNFPAGKFPAQLPDTFIWADISGPAFSVAKQKLSMSSSPIVIDIKASAELLNSKKGKHSYSINKERLKKIVSAQLAPVVRLHSVAPDTLLFVLENSINKKLPVVPKLEITLAHQHFIVSKPSVFPDSVAVHGPASVVGPMGFINTSYAISENTSQNIELVLRLDMPEKVSSEIENVTVAAEIGRFTERVFNLPINIAGRSLSDSLVLMPDFVKLSFNIALCDYNAVSEGDFHIAALFPEAGSMPDKLNLIIQKQHPNAWGIKILPDKVDYVVKKRE
jgi:hypothetical protein